MTATMIEARELSRLTDEQLLDAYFQDGDLAARDELVARFMPYARTLAVRYMHSREPMDDLTQVAYIGLLNAIERFDPERGTTFTTFATPTILGELRSYFRDRAWPLHVARNIQERALAIRRHAERLAGELGRPPNLVELADALGCTVDQAVEAIDAGESSQLTSLDAADTLGRDDDGFELAEDRDVLATNWTTLSDLERQVLGLRLVHGLTQHEISRQIGYSQMHVSRLLRRSIVSLNAGETQAMCAAARRAAV